MEPNVWQAFVSFPESRKHVMRTPFFLPYPNLPKISVNRPDWPKDGWQTYISCPLCGDLALFEKRNIVWGMAALSADRVLRVQNPVYKVFLRCEQLDCGSRIEVLSTMPRGETSLDLEKRLSGGSGDPKCSNGHSLLRPVVVSKTVQIADLE